MPKPISPLDYLPIPGGGHQNPADLEALPMPVETVAPVDSETALRRSAMYAVGDLSGSIPEGSESILENFNKRRQSIENSIMLGQEAQLKRESLNKLLNQKLTTYIDLKLQNDVSPEVQYGAQMAFNLALNEKDIAEQTAASEKRYVENLQAVVATGRVDEAAMMAKLHNDDNAYVSAVKSQERRAYMQGLIEDEIAGEENRFWLFNITDVLSYMVPFSTSSSQAGNVSTKGIGEENFFDNILSGDRLNKEAWALNSMSDHDFYTGGAKNFVKNATKNATVFGGLGKNNMMRQSVFDMYTRKTPSANETNAWDLADGLLAPFALYDVVTGAKATRSVFSMLKKAGARSTANSIVKNVLAEVAEKGLAQAAKDNGMTPQAVEEALTLSAMNPTANPHDVSTAGEIITDLDRAEEAAQRLLNNPLLTERLTEEEIATAIPLMEARVKKDFGRHVHDIRMDTVSLVNGSSVLSPVVRMGTTGKGLFVTEAQAAEQAARIGLADAKVVPVVSDNGTLFAIEGRLPITESQFYVAHAPNSSTPKNFIERFLYGSRQTSADSSYGLAETATAKRQRVVTAIIKSVGPYFDSLNATERKMLKDILVRAEQDQKWYNHMEFSLLWARLSGVGDDAHEITDTSIALGNIPSPGGAAVDPEFLSQKNFLDLKDRSAGLGKQADDIFRNSGVADEATFWANASDADKAIMDELTAINAQIAKGPQRVEPPTIDAFLEPHTYKAQRAMEPTGEAPAGTVRVYHGGGDSRAKDWSKHKAKLWVTTSLDDAKGWANGGDVFYNYVDEFDTRINPNGTMEEGFAPNTRFELNEAEAATMRPFREAGRPPKEGARIEESAGKGVVLQYPTYEAFIKEAKKVGMSEKEIQDVTGVTPETFVAMREVELQKYVEAPAQQTVRDIWAEGGFPYSSNAFGPGQKGVAYAERGGRNKHRELPELPEEDVSNVLFPPEHEDLWKALDNAANDALAMQARAGDISKARTRKAAEMSTAKEARDATPHLDRLVDLFRNGVRISEIARRLDGTRLVTPTIFSLPNKNDLLGLVKLAHVPDAKLTELGTRSNGVRLLELPGGRYFAWVGHEDLHENVLRQLNVTLSDRNLPAVEKGDVNNIWIEVVQDKEGVNKAGRVEIDEPMWTGEDYSWVPTARMKFSDFTVNANSYAVEGPAFNSRVKDAERKANEALGDAMTGGPATEAFREAVDKGLTLSSTNKLVNANGDVLHTNRQKVMSRPLEYDPSMDGRVSSKARAAFNKMIEVNNIEHLLRNQEAYLQKAIRGMQTFSFESVKDVDGIVYRAGSMPGVPSSRVYNISDKLHYVAKSEDTVKEGQALRLTEADISRMLKKEGYVMVKLEQPQIMKGNIAVQWYIGKAQDFEIKPLKFEQIGYRAGGHRGYVDKYYGKQVRLGRQGDNNEKFLMNPHTFTVGTKAQVEEWSSIMNDTRAIINNTDDPERQLELLSQLLDNKPGYPSGAELQAMVKNGDFDPEFPVEAVYDREVPTDHAKFKGQGWDDMSEEEQTGLNSYFQTQGRMYTSPKGERLRDWEGQDATVIDPFAMMNKSLSQIAGLSSLSDYKLREVEKWIKTFGQYLDTTGLPRDASPIRIFQESVFRRDMPDAQKIKNSAEAQRDTIKRVLGWRSDVDREFEYVGRQLVDFVSGGKPTKWNKKLNRSLNWALETDPVAKARMLAFHMKMGVGNVAQFPMQITTMLAATSIDAVGGMRGMFNLVPMIGYLTKTSGDEWLQMWIEAGWHKRVGFDNPEDWIEMMKAAKQSGRFDIGGAHQLINYNGVEAAQGIIGKAGKALSKTAFFFNEAERWNQTVGWTIAWHRSKKAGLIPGTAKFNEVQMKTSGDFSFNMSKAGAAAWQQGWASIPTQFLSYQARVLEALLGKQFTVPEKLRLLLGQVVMYGTAGAPFLPFLSEKLRGDSGSPAELGSWEGLLDRGIIDTMIWGLTGEDTQFGERAGTGGFVTDTFRELMGMSKYGQVSFIDVMGGPIYGISKSIFFGETGKPGTFWETVRFMSAESGGDTGLPLTSAAIVDLAKNITSFNNSYKAYMVWNYGQYVTTSGKVALDELPSTDAFAVFLGLTPGEYRDYVAKQDWRRNRSEIVKGIADQIVELRQRKVREPDNGESIDSQMELFRNMHPEDLWIDGFNQAGRSDANESIADGLARRYEIEKQQEQMAKEARKQ